MKSKKNTEDILYQVNAIYRDQLKPLVDNFPDKVIQISVEIVFSDQTHTFITVNKNVVKHSLTAIKPT